VAQAKVLVVPVGQHVRQTATIQLTVGKVVGVRHGDKNHITHHDYGLAGYSK
jgi:hypothetical protein